MIEEAGLARRPLDFMRDLSTAGGSFNWFHEVAREAWNIRKPSQEFFQLSKYCCQVLGAHVLHSIACTFLLQTPVEGNRAYLDMFKAWDADHCQNLMQFKSQLHVTYMHVLKCFTIHFKTLPRRYLCNRKVTIKVRCCMWQRHFIAQSHWQRSNSFSQIKSVAKHLCGSSDSRMNSNKHMNNTNYRKHYHKCTDTWKQSRFSLHARTVSDATHSTRLAPRWSIHDVL